jgi:Spy/CpxP family protein refolding chaperone
MKHRIATLSALLLAASAAVAVAQAPPTGGPPQGTPGQGGGGGAARRMQAMLQGITLTAPQQTRFDSIRAAYQAQMPAFTPGSPPDSAARAKSMEVRQRRDADLRAVLTTEQQTIWDRNMANMPAGPPRRPN